MININKFNNKEKLDNNNFKNKVINLVSDNMADNEEKNKKNKSETESQEEDLKFNNSFNAKGICLDTFKNKKDLIKNEEQKNEINENKNNNSNQNNEENRVNVTYKPDNDKTDINFEDLTNTNNLNNHTKSKGANPSSNASHRLSKKKSGIVISDDIDEDEEYADGVIFKNRGKLIYDKNNNVSEETNHMF